MSESNIERLHEEIFELKESIEKLELKKAELEQMVLALVKNCPYENYCFIPDLISKYKDDKK